MNGLDIKRDEWADFLHAYEVEHGGWLVHVENGNGESEAFEEHGAVLERLRYNAQQDEILLSLGWHGETEVLRFERPRDIQLLNTDDSGDVGIEITGEDGKSHALWLRQASPA